MVEGSINDGVFLLRHLFPRSVSVFLYLAVTRLVVSQRPRCRWRRRWRQLDLCWSWHFPSRRSARWRHGRAPSRRYLMAHAWQGLLLHRDGYVLRTSTFFLLESSRKAPKCLISQVWNLARLFKKALISLGVLVTHGLEELISILLLVMKTGTNCCKLMFKTKEEDKATASLVAAIGISSRCGRRSSFITTLWYFYTKRRTKNVSEGFSLFPTGLSKTVGDIFFTFF